MEPHPPSQPRPPRGFAATAATAATSVSPTSTPSGSAGATTTSYSGKEKREREKENERTKFRKWHRRAFTSRMLSRLRQYGNFPLPARADMNEVLAALAREAGWTVELGDTTYRHSPTPQNHQNLGTFSARSGESPLSTNSLKNCSVKATLDCKPAVVRIDERTRSRLDVSSANKETFLANKKPDNKFRPEGLPPSQRRN